MIVAGRRRGTVARVVAVGALLSLIVLLAACGDDTAGSTVSAAPNGTTDERHSDADAVDLAATFDSVRLRVFDADGVECGICTWQADTATERARGLMDVRSLGGAFGMVFQYDEPTDAAFWMKDTLVPLTIVYYDADGSYVGAQDMAPCRNGSACPSYPPTGDFVYAVEVRQGTAEDLGLVAGSTIAIGEPCTPDPALVERMLDTV